MRNVPTSLAVLAILAAAASCLAQAPVRQPVNDQVKDSPSDRLIDPAFGPGAAVELTRKLSRLQQAAGRDASGNPAIDEAQAKLLRRWAAENGWDLDALRRLADSRAAASGNKLRPGSQPQVSRGATSQPVPQPPRQQSDQTGPLRRSGRAAPRQAAMAGRDAGSLESQSSNAPDVRQPAPATGTEQGIGVNRLAPRTRRSRGPVPSNRNIPPSEVRGPARSDLRVPPFEVPPSSGAREGSASRIPPAAQRRKPLSGARDLSGPNRAASTQPPRAQRGQLQQRRRQRDSRETQRGVDSSRSGRGELRRGEPSRNRRVASRNVDRERPLDWWRGLRATYRDVLAKARAQSRSGAPGPADGDSVAGVREAVTRALDATARDLIDRGVQLRREHRGVWRRSSIGPRTEAFMRSLNRTSRSTQRWMPANAGHVRAPGIGAPNIGAPDLRGVGGIGTVLWIGILAMLILVAVHLLQRGTLRGARRSARPVYVAPHSIQSRSDLVRAFEGLALRRLGLRIASWSHWRIARSLRGAPESAEAAARLYELARYAPEAAPLSHAELQRARSVLAALERGRA